MKKRYFYDDDNDDDGKIFGKKNKRRIVFPYLKNDNFTVKPINELNIENETDSELNKVENEIERKENFNSLRGAFFGGDSTANFLSKKSSDEANKEGYGFESMAKNIFGNHISDKRKINEIIKEEQLKLEAFYRCGGKNLQTKIFEEQEKKRTENLKKNNEILEKKIGKEVSKRLGKEDKEEELEK